MISKVRKKFPLNSYKNISALRRGFCAELSDMCYHLNAMSLVTLILLTTRYVRLTMVDTLVSSIFFDCFYVIPEYSLLG